MRSFRHVPRQIRFNSTSSTVLKPPRIDISRILDNYNEVYENCLARQLPHAAASLPEIRKLNELRLQQLHNILPLETQRNEISKQLPTVTDLTRRKFLLDDALRIKTKIGFLKKDHERTVQRLTSLACALPNETHPSVPSEITEIAQINAHNPSKVSKDHVEIAEDLGLLDLVSGAKTTGHAWYYLTGLAVQLELAIVSYALDMAVRRGWKQVKPPDVVRTEIAAACGYHPRDEHGEQVYRLQGSTLGGVDSVVKEEGHLCLSGTAEIPLAAMGLDTTYQEEELPLRVVGVGTAFRAEAGSRGRETKGLYRVHQFTKVELFAWTTQDQSDEMLREILDLQAEIIAGLDLHARTIEMPPPELGNAAYRKYDIEAWMYGRSNWGEVTSASNCTDYQTRRLNTRYRPREHNAKLLFAHTLNGTAAAVPRLIISIMENGVQGDGSVVIPKSLQRYMGTDLITRN
jgi:seryl-tRNA synthetase